MVSMNKRLKQMAATLLIQADQAVDRADNGLWVREDFIQLIDQLRQLTRNLLNEQNQLECDRGELMHRLRRSATHAAINGSAGPGLVSRFPPRR
jgi:hypothetical protein